MCGIFLNIFRDHGCKYNLTKFQDLISNRGPDVSHKIDLVVGNGWNCTLMESVLWTQGDQVKTQPLCSEDGSFLLWNGDVFYGLPNSGCDTEAVFSELIDHGLSTFSKICGPYAFIYYDALLNVLWFGRDPLGRHSLLWNINSMGLLLTSVSPRTVEIEEVPNCGIFKIDLSEEILQVQLHPWNHLPQECIKVNVPYNLLSDLSHPSFTLPVQNDWYNREPQLQELEFLNELTENIEATSVFEHLLKKPSILSAVQKLESLIIHSTRRRIETKPNYCCNCISSFSNCDHSKVAILFSGGLDSTILALISNLIVPLNESIDLYNVSFDTVRSNGNFLVPDRKNGYESLKELSKLAPERKWNFVEINVNRTELEEFRSRHIADLIYPLVSILDDSLGCALWFAAQGKGVLEGQPYTSPARVVLLGMGADEMFGGYSRHRKEFKKHGWTGLGLQLIEEVRNIGKRNLGRDNRVVTDHGRQPRMPYLDENLIHYVSTLPPWLRCCLNSNMPIGIGDKMLLRCLAWNLELRYCSNLPKKALQFGSKIADPKEKGHELSKRLLSKQNVE